VQKGCREDEHRVVVPLADTPQKRYGRPSPEQVNSMKRMRSGGSTLPSRVRVCGIPLFSTSQQHS
jgi:hypothetical protein